MLLWLYIDKEKIYIIKTGIRRLGGVGVSRPPNIFKFARKLVKRQPCCKKVGNSIFCDLFFFSNNSWSLRQNAPPPIEGVSAHHWVEKYTENRRSNISTAELDVKGASMLNRDSEAGRVQHFQPKRASSCKRARKCIENKLEQSFPCRVP